ncbi:unnamed protein product, partial [Bubo scandiacus]
MAVGTKQVNNQIENKLNRLCKLEDLLNLILKDAFEKKELIFYRQLCYLGPEIWVTLKEEKARLWVQMRNWKTLWDNTEAYH